MKNSQKGFIVPLLIAIIAVLVIGGGVYIYNNKKVGEPVLPEDTTTQTTTQNQQQTNTRTLPVTLDLSSSSTSNWKTYTNNEYGFEFKYPTDWTYVQPSKFVTSIRFFKSSKIEEYKKFIDGGGDGAYGDSSAADNVGTTILGVYAKGNGSTSLDSYLGGGYEYEQGNFSETKIGDKFIVKIGQKDHMYIGHYLFLNSNHANGVTFSVDYNPLPSNGLLGVEDPIIEKIVSTFKFTR
ncbi:MAG: hypothetical protein NTZ87_04025 [Candidatus Nomurabacteria bacterium]|nr:hypothetical protein [Candidatus Nomurabacteria bacterium]